MFERYTEKARRVIFFARYEASEFGSPAIETDHLLLGILREDKALANRFLPSGYSVESIRQRVRALTTVRDKIATSVDLPLSHESKCVLAYAAEETDRLKHQNLSTEHLLLGLLREERCLAANLLRERGLHLEDVREELAARGAESSTNPETRLKSTVLKYLESLPNELGILAGESHIYVKPDRVTPPFLFIKILSPTVSFGEVRQRSDEHFANRLRYVWLLDPVSRRAYVVTPQDGLHEFKGEVLRTENPALELPLAEVFA